MIITQKGNTGRDDFSFAEIIFKGIPLFFFIYGMRKIVLCSSLFLLVWMAYPVCAQTQYRGQALSIVDALQESVPGKGEVEINQSPAIRNLLGTRKASMNDDMPFLETPGYRAQVFSGNLRNSKEEAFKKEKEIKELYPELVTYVTYVAPFWRLRVGDYRSHEEAYHTMRILMNSFPSYAKEMYIVREDVKIPLY